MIKLNLLPRGVLPVAVAAVIVIAIILWASRAGACSREDFGGYTQENYKDTRARMLEKHAIGPIRHRVGSNGKYIVTFGSWVDAFSGRELRNVDARDVQIDHVIPLKWACDHGADGWSKERKKQFFNDMRYLMVVEAGINASKGAKGPDEFMPSRRELACDYVVAFIDAARVYRLIFSPVEKLTIAEIHFEVCGTRVSIS